MTLKKTVLKILEALPFVFLGLALLLIIQIVISVRQEKTPTIFGYGIFIVVSPSMEDKIMEGDLIFVDTSADDYDFGDIITFHQPGAEGNIITHEIVGIKTIDGENYYTTKGYNNDSSIDWEIDFTEDHIIGKYVFRSGFLGKIYSAVFNGTMNFVYAIVILVFLMIAVFEVTNIVKEVSLARHRELAEEKTRLMQAELEKLRQEDTSEKNEKENL